MADIYRSARVVYMWLGEEEDESDLAMELAQQIERYLELRLEGKGPSVHLKDFDFRRHWLAMPALLSRPYWVGVPLKVS